MGIEILVLGDSALSSLGGVFPNAFDLICDAHSYSSPVHFRNASAVGMTAADAWAHLQAHPPQEPLHGVILYVGNCDACGFGVAKPRAPLGLGARRARWRTVRMTARNPMLRRNLPYRFVEHVPAANHLEPCVSPGDHAAFLERIVHIAVTRNLHVFIVHPTAKSDFPPCNNTGNFLFYKIVGIPDQQPYEASAAPPELTAALRAQSEGALEEALDLYRLVERRSRRGELAWIARNNSAVIHSLRGDYTEALRLLAGIPSRGTPMHPLILFNQALVERARGAESAALALLHEARELDTGTYRITAAYGIQASPREPASGGLEHHIDLARELHDADFADYCHPTLGGHRKIAAVLASAIETAFGLQSGTHPPRVSISVLPPDRYAGARSGFFAAFGMLPAVDEEFTARVRAEAAVMPYSTLLEQEPLLEPDLLRRVRLRIAAHPLCGSETFLCASPPEHSVDQGQMPELYFLRHLLPIYRRWAERPDLRHLCAPAADLLPQFDRVARWWPALGLDPERPTLQELASLAARLDFDTILLRARTLLRKTLAREPRLYARYRTVTYWFLRESLLFGSASHYSMYYDRLALHHVASSCLFVLWHAAPGSAAAAASASLMQQVTAQVDIHARFLVPWAERPYALPPSHDAAYRQALQALRLALESAPEATPEPPPAG